MISLTELPGGRPAAGELVVAAIALHTAAVEVTTATVPGAGGLPLVIDRLGPVGGQPVLLLHGGGQNRHAWKGTGRRLAAGGYQVVSADARGHGDSAWSPTGDYEMLHFADDVDHLLELFNRPAIVVGASMGGIAALLAQGRSDRQLFRAVVLVDVTPRMEVAGVERIIGFMSARPDGFATLEEAADVIAAYNPRRKPSTSTEGLTKVLQWREGRWQWRWDPRFITSKGELLSGDDAATARRVQQMGVELLAAAARVAVPTLLIRGRESDLVSDASVNEFLDTVPHADYVDLAGAGHMVAGDDNDAFTETVMSFLEGLAPPPSN